MLLRNGKRIIFQDKKPELVHFQTVFSELLNSNHPDIKEFLSEARKMSSTPIEIYLENNELYFKAKYSRVYMISGFLSTSLPLCVQGDTLIISHVYAPKKNAPINEDIAKHLLDAFLEAKLITQAQRDSFKIITKDEKPKP